MKQNRLLWTIAVCLAALFAVKTGLDYYTYTTTLNSAPFWVWIAVNAIYFLLPAVIVSIVALILERKK